MGISRRKFLAIGLVFGVLPVYTLYAWRFGDPTGIIVAILKRRVGHLRVKPETFHEFAKDYVLHMKEYERELAVLTAFSFPLKFFSPYRWLKQGNAFRRLADSVVSDYLLSTDFFFNGANEQRDISYIAYYDPYTRPCSNPFNRQP